MYIDFGEKEKSEDSNDVQFDIKCMILALYDEDLSSTSLLTVKVTWHRCRFGVVACGC